MWVAWTVVMLVDWSVEMKAAHLEVNLAGSKVASLVGQKVAWRAGTKAERLVETRVVMKVAR